MASSTPGGELVTFSDLCHDPPLPGYCFRLTDLSKETTDEAANVLQPKAKRTIKKLEAGTKKEVVWYRFGKSTSMGKLDVPLDVLNGSTLIKRNICSRWSNHRNELKYDGLVVLAALPKFYKSGQDRALELEQELIDRFRNESRLHSTNPNEGQEAGPDWDIGIVYLAYKLARRKKPCDVSELSSTMGALKLGKKK